MSVSSYCLCMISMLVNPTLARFCWASCSCWVSVKILLCKICSCANFCNRLVSCLPYLPKAMSLVSWAYGLPLMCCLVKNISSAVFEGRFQGHFYAFSKVFGFFGCYRCFIGDTNCQSPLISSHQLVSSHETANECQKACNRIFTLLAISLALLTAASIFSLIPLIKPCMASRPTCSKSLPSFFKASTMLPTNFLRYQRLFENHL